MGSSACARGESVWPSMSAYAFAHTSPVWISQLGSTDGAASRLGPVLDVAQQQVVIAYGGDANARNILAQFAAARERLAAAVR